MLSIFLLSRASVTLQHILFLETIRPGTHRRVEKTTFIVTVHIWTYVCLLFNKFFSHSKCSTTTSVEMAGFEPATFALQRRCSPTELHPQDLPWVSGLDRIRTCDPCV